MYYERSVIWSAVFEINWRYDPHTCWTILSNCLMNLKNSGDSTGFEPMTSAMPVQCSNQLSYEVTQLRAGQFVGLMFSPWKECSMKEVLYESPEFFRFMRQLLKIVQQVRGSYLQLISNTALHITLLSYYIPFTGKHEPNKLTCSQLCDFIAQLVRALHRHRRGHGFESRWVTWIFQVHETIA